MLIAPPIGIAVLLLLPFLSGEGEKSWRRRPIAVLTVLLLFVPQFILALAATLHQPLRNAPRLSEVHPS